MSIKPSICQDISVPCIDLNNLSLTWVESQKYLGVFITSNLLDCMDIRRQLLSIYARGNQLVRKFKGCSNDVKVVGLHPFRTYCSNEYGCHLLTHFKKKNLRKAKVAYNNTFRYLFNLRRGSISKMFLEYNVDTFNVILRKSIYNLRSQMYMSLNHLIALIMREPFFMFKTLCNN